MKKIEKNLNSIVWDTTKTWAYYPEKLKNLYKEIYLKNYKNYSIWINEISKNNVDNICSSMLDCHSLPLFPDPWRWYAIFF